MKFLLFYAYFDINENIGVQNVQISKGDYYWDLQLKHNYMGIFKHCDFQQQNLVIYVELGKCTTQNSRIIVVTNGEGATH